MKEELAFKTDSLFYSISYDKDADSWTFSFADDIYVEASGFWRLFERNKIVYVSLDNGHQFVLPKPLDLVEELTTILKDKKLKELNVDKDTADLTLVFTDNMRIEIFISSSGYETHQFSINGKIYVGLGSGDIAILDFNQ